MQSSDMGQQEEKLDPTPPLTLFLPLQSEYKVSLDTFGIALHERIAQMRGQKQTRVYCLEVGDKVGYLQQLWHQAKTQITAPTVPSLLSQRLTAVYQDISHGMLCIPLQKTVQPQENISQPVESEAAKVINYAQFIREQRKHKEERKRMREQFKKKEQISKSMRQREEREKEEREAQERRSMLIKKQKESHEKRRYEGEERRMSDIRYREVARSMMSNPPLFIKMQVRKEEIVPRQREEEQLSIEEHERRYEEMRVERERQRRQRMREQERLLQLQEQQIMEKYNKIGEKEYNSSVELYKETHMEMRQQAREKQERMKKYIEETVKEKYLPQIDQEKRRELLQAIEDMGRKGMRKVKGVDGVVYEEVKHCDARMIGLEYLEKIKQITSKIRKREKSVQQSSNVSQNKKRDYLAQLRNKPRYKRSSTTEIIRNKQMTFEERAKIVQIQTRRLEDMAKQKQMQLKFGKFNTSQEILQHKESIDQHYIDIVNLKLSLISQ